LPSQRAKVNYPLLGVITNPHPLGGDLLLLNDGEEEAIFELYEKRKNKHAHSYVYVVIMK